MLIKGPFHTPIEAPPAPSAQAKRLGRNQSSAGETRTPTPVWRIMDRPRSALRVSSMLVGLKNG